MALSKREPFRFWFSTLALNFGPVLRAIRVNIAVVSVSVFPISTRKLEITTGRSPLVDDGLVLRHRKNASLPRAMRCNLPNYFSMEVKTSIDTDEIDTANDYILSHNKLQSIKKKKTQKDTIRQDKNMCDCVECGDKHQANKKKQLTQISR